MNKNHLKKSIRKAIFQLLVEKSEDSPGAGANPERRKPRSSKQPAAGSISIAPGGIGRGNFNRFVKEAKARAESDPEGLLEDLGVKGGAGGDDLQQIAQIFNQAILTNDTMGEAYAGASKKTEKNKNDKVVEVVAVTPAGINVRNGIKFLAYTLEAAKATGVFSPRGAIVFSKGEYFPIVVYSL